MLLRNFAFAIGMSFLGLVSIWKQEEGDLRWDRLPDEGGGQLGALLRWLIWFLLMYCLFGKSLETKFSDQSRFELPVPNHSDVAV